MAGGDILVARGGAIGDFVLTLPVFTALRRAFPRARLEVLGYPHIARLALAGGLVDGLMPIEARELAGFFARNGELAPDLSKFFGRFDIIFSFLYDPDGVFQENVAKASRAQFLQGPHRPEEKGCVHAVDVFLEPLRRLAIFDAEREPALRIGGGAQSEAREQRIALHPGSGSPSKNWPLARWASLIDQLASREEFRLVLFGGEMERSVVGALASRLPGSRFEVVLCQPLEQAARILSGCDVYVGHDSGVTHLAAACGVRTVVLWGPTCERTWCPLGPHVQLLRSSQGLQGLETWRVLEAIRSSAAGRVE